MADSPQNLSVKEAAAPAELYPMHGTQTQNDADRELARRLPLYFENSIGTDVDKIKAFPKFVPRQYLSVFLAKHEMFQKILNIHGSIIECGVFMGGGLMSWANFSAIHEPFNNTRRVVGFDTFSGFVEVHEKDKGHNMFCTEEGGLAVPAYDDIQEAIRLFDLNRPIGHISRVQLVAGDANKTIPEYIQQNQHLVVALLYLDFDLYEPTKTALKHFLPRMPKGSIIAFDQLGHEIWPGETLAALEEVGIRNIRVERFSYASCISYAVLD